MKKIIIILLFGFGLATNSYSIQLKDMFSYKEKMILLDSINKYRTDIGLKELKYSVEGEKLANIRVSTIYYHIKNTDSLDLVKNYKNHLHKGLYDDYLDFNTKLELYGNYKMPIILENVIYSYSQKVLNDFIVNCFHGWKSSKGHWEAMMSEGIDHISLASGSGENGIVVNLILFDKFDKKKK